MAFIDNIRWVIIVLVLSMHAADTYSPFGNWYYTEHLELGQPTIFFFGTYQSFLQAFSMALLFFIAGYFTPASYDKKGAVKFLTDRFMRLGVPTLLYMLVIGPLTEYYVSQSWRTPDSFAKAWWGHIADGEVFSMTGPMWFCAALLIFCGVYVAIRKISNRVPFTSSLSISLNDKNVVLLIATVAISTFGIKLFDPTGASVFNMHPVDFPSYIILFTVGIFAYRGGWLERLEFRFGLRWGALALGIGGLLWVALMAFGGALSGDFSAYEAGWHWQNLGMCLWAAIVCVGFGLGWIVLFREKFNFQGPAARFMSANAFAVYLFHPPILIALALLLHSVAAPGLFKFAFLTALSVVVSFAAGEYLFRRIPLLSRIL
jgi:peptidoglycan/LPS O-acetylase OafA/YrhL